MDLKELLGESYKENMTVEEINAALSGKTLVDPETLPKSVSKDVFDKTASELAKYKKDLRALQEKTMTEEEKQKEILEKAALAEQTYKKELSRIKAIEVFAKGGLTESEYGNLLDMAVSDDSEQSVKNAKNILDLLTARKEAVEKAVKAELLKNTPTPPGGNSGGNTKEDFAKMTLTEKARLKMENPELYEKMMKL